MITFIVSFILYLYQSLDKINIQKITFKMIDKIQFKVRYSIPGSSWFKNF